VDGKLVPGTVWVQETVIGGRFAAHYRAGPDGTIVPRIRGRAYAVAHTKPPSDLANPFADGIRS
jgi:4-hydroxyproline epimerase